MQIYEHIINNNNLTVPLQWVHIHVSIHNVYTESFECKIIQFAIGQMFKSYGIHQSCGTRQMYYNGYIGASSFEYYN